METPLEGRHLGFFTSVVGHGGSEVLIADAVEAAAEAGAMVTVWSDASAAIRRILDGRPVGPVVVHRDWPPRSKPAMASTAGSPAVAPVQKRSWKSLIPVWLRRALGFRREARRFAEELAQHPVDLLMVNVNGSEAVSLAGPRTGTPVINIYHLSYTSPLGNWWLRRGDQWARRATLRAGTRTIHTSQAVCEQWSQQFGEARLKSFVIYNGVDPNSALDAHRRGLRRELGVADDELLAIVPARLEPVKGHSVLIAALTAMRSQLANLQIWLCGDGVLRPALEQAVQQAGLQDRVAFQGQRPDLPRILAAADLVILPSVASENLSVAVLEGFAAGRPAIVTAVGGMAEAVKDGVTGYVVPPNDADALVAILRRVLSDPNQLESMGRATRDDWAKRFTRNRMKADYVAAFVEVLR